MPFMTRCNCPVTLVLVTFHIGKKAPDEVSKHQKHRLLRELAELAWHLAYHEDNLIGPDSQPALFARA
jgi:hypothetical protein